MGARTAKAERAEKARKDQEKVAGLRALAGQCALTHDHVKGLCDLDRQAKAEARRVLTDHYRTPVGREELARAPRWLQGLRPETIAGLLLEER